MSTRCALMRKWKCRKQLDMLAALSVGITDPFTQPKWPWRAQNCIGSTCRMQVLSRYVRGGGAGGGGGHDPMPDTTVLRMGSGQMPPPPILTLLQSCQQ